MLRDGINGFCMALADSVPGVSGGTVAFIMGFYDDFIGSIHYLVFGNMKQKKQALIYLIRLGIGWIVGMALASIVLSSLFERHIYIISSVFIGFVAGAIPLIIWEEKDVLKQKRGLLYFVVGIFIVVGCTWLNGKTGNTTMDLSSFSLQLCLRLFFIGMIAISAMFLPGISGSTMLLIFGAYMPVITAIKNVLSFDLSYLPCLIVFGLGILTGASSIVKVIKIALDKYRAQMIYMIIGMLVGSFYAIIMGPTTLKVPQVALSFSNFHILATIIGIILVLSLQFIKEKGDNYGHRTQIS